MAGTVLVPQVMTGREVSITPAYVAAAAQMEMPNSAPAILHVKATAGGAVNVTITNQTRAPDGAPNPNKVVNVPVSGERMIRLDDGTFNMSNGSAQLAFDVPANATVAVYQLQ